ncbi:pyruvate, phosphate dikinase [Patescibacteria group bacterium]|nr:pyruvate, phosphate dikinase [Patescibacteria group bacterium]MBU1703256.1 pyruvate, phosphate dikinase [Patescibacteria group bacterium]MBU1953764.1 pyruvate, phosphate dikinase [Patescibacteria group bacterium]
MAKYIYAFHEGNREMKSILGGKGANLAEMTLLDLPVPPGFTITTEACEQYLKDGSFFGGFDEELARYLEEVEEKLGSKFGDDNNPLLVSVRSGAAVSMPGMMDTILNLGLNDKTVLGLLKKTGNERFCYDAYRRFVNMFGNVVLGVAHDNFEEEMDKLKEKKGVKLDTDLDAEDLKALVESFKKVVMDSTGAGFPDDPREQLKLAIKAVFDSWNNDRAKTYRRLNDIVGLKGTAVNVQAMVFGNMGGTSGTGVAFTRNPSTGEKEFYGEFLMNAQGEDVVAGIRTPQKLSQLNDVMPEVYKELDAVREKLEAHYRDMQDIEFTIQEGKLFMLQTRSGKRTAKAQVNIACDMVDEGLITRDEALLRIDANRMNQLLHPDIDPDAEKNVIAKGLPASPGAACGRVVFTADDASDWKFNRDEKVILVRKETSPEDIHGMHASQGILTSTGGMTSHAAVVARGMGKCCIAGCNDISVDLKNKVLRVGPLEVQEGDYITLNGSTGEVILGEVPMVDPELTDNFKKILDWSNEIKRLKVRVNADTPLDAKVGREFGAEGIGLCRTEHMFFDEDRIKAVRKMILSISEEGRRGALETILPMQQKDFEGIFREMDGLPVTIRLLDPPLHEFLPQKEDQILELAEEMGMEIDKLKRVIDQLHEINPMLGHRGSRLGLTNPEIYEMQVKAIIQAGIAVSKDGIKVLPEIELPFIACEDELVRGRAAILDVIKQYGDAVNFECRIGTMIELPRACLTADELAQHADFFSFGTNDLTQTTWGMSRDDSGKFLNYYLENGVLERDPSSAIDQKGVGKLMDTCVQLGRKAKKDIEIGICGEQGGEPSSVEFCHKIGLDYVSLSPYRVPIARIAAAQAALKNK